MVHTEKERWCQNTHKKSRCTHTQREKEKEKESEKKMIHKTQWAWWCSECLVSEVGRCMPLVSSVFFCICLFVCAPLLFLLLFVFFRTPRVFCSCSNNYAILFCCWCCRCWWLLFCCCCGSIIVFPSYSSFLPSPVCFTVVVVVATASGCFSL